MNPMSLPIVLYEKVSYPSIRMHLYGDVEHGVVESNDVEIV